MIVKVKKSNKSNKTKKNFLSNSSSRAPYIIYMKIFGPGIKYKIHIILKNVILKLFWKDHNKKTEFSYTLNKYLITKVS